jgi:hypothetical protein
MQADSDGGDKQPVLGDENKAETEMEVVEVSHPVARNDTVLSIARKYAADVSGAWTLHPVGLSSSPRISVHLPIRIPTTKDCSPLPHPPFLIVLPLSVSL